MDHISGNRSDNRITNLRLLCPNCHSQTTTFGTKNHKNQRERDKKINVPSVQEIKCPHCSKAFLAVRTQKFCSRKCGIESRNYEESKKLSDQDVLKIRRMYDDAVPGIDIQKLYPQVSDTTISRIGKRKRRRNIPEETLPIES